MMGLVNQERTEEQPILITEAYERKRATVESHTPKQRQGM
jgi:hypothetical protein